MLVLKIFIQNSSYNFLPTFLNIPTSFLKQTQLRSQSFRNTILNRIWYVHIIATLIFTSYATFHITLQHIAAYTLRKPADWILTSRIRVDVRKQNKFQSFAVSYLLFLFEKFTLPHNKKTKLFSHNILFLLL